jgi:hypothetical protein
VRREVVLPPVTGEERHLVALELTRHDDVRRGTERRVDPVLGGVLEQLVEAGTADDAEGHALFLSAVLVVVEVLEVFDEEPLSELELLSPEPDEPLSEELDDPLSDELDELELRELAA